MLMVNTVLFGVGAGLVAYCWLLFAVQPEVDPTGYGGLWTFEERLLVATVAILLGGFFHSIAVLYPEMKRHEDERNRSSLRANQMENQAMSDPLTGIYNRRYFDRALKIYFAEFKMQEASFGLLLLDLDHFKEVNDTHGHGAGDTVLKAVAEQLKTVSREYDIPARIGGEEFAIITPYASYDELVGIAERYRQAIDGLRVAHDAMAIATTVSIGVATNIEGDDAESLFRTADRRLYDAKRNGRNRIAA